MFFGLLQDALERYRQRQQKNPDDAKAVLGCMKCLDALGEWGDLVELCNEKWDTITKKGEDSSQRKAANMAARSAYVALCDVYDSVISCHAMSFHVFVVS